MTKILGKLKPYTFQIILGAVLTLAGVYADLFLPEIMSRIINQGVAGADKQFILVQGLKMLLFALLAVVCGVSSGYFSARVSIFSIYFSKSKQIRKIGFLWIKKSYAIEE